MLSTLAHALAEGMVEYENQPPRVVADQQLYGLNALYRLYPADGGWVFLAAPQEREWPLLATALAEWVDLGSDPRFSDSARRATNDEELAEALAAVFAQRSPGEWEATLVGADIACVEAAAGPVERILTSNEGLGRDHGYLVDVEHETLGEHVRLAPLVRFSRSEGVAGVAHLVGQDTDHVLTELGYDAARLADLRDRQIIGG